MSSREIERGTQRVVQDISHEDIPYCQVRKERALPIMCSFWMNMDPIGKIFLAFVMHNFSDLIEPDSLSTTLAR